MLCVPIQVELIEAAEDAVGTRYVAIGGFVTGTYPRSGPSVYRPYLVCVKEGGELISVPLDECKLVGVLPQSVFVTEPPQVPGIVAVTSTGSPVGVS